jgi:hypothetical protein
VADCALCGTPAPPPFRAPAPEMAPDLDLRPGEPARSTLNRWVLQCRGCGACAPDLAALPPSEVVTTAVYRGTRSRFLRWAVLVEGTKDEAEALLQAAWEADDRGEDATLLRSQAAAVWPTPQTAEQRLRLADVLRRAGDFTAASECLAPLANAPDDTTRLIVAYQQARVAARDTGRHLMSSALRPPASKPHVAHGPTKISLLGRIFGGKAR